MAYDTLKAEIRQYIQTNGQQEITGQILQNVLLDMVNAYPSLDGYATQQWVSNQLNDMATQTWVGNNYLPLTGGTLTGNLNIADIKNINILIDHDTFFDSVLRLGNDGNGTVLNFYVGGSGLELNRASITTAGYFVGQGFQKDGGTSSQFLKADGSVDSNNYLALSGGTITGNLDVNGTLKIAINNSLSFGAHLEIFRQSSTDILVMKNDDQDIVLGSLGNNYYVDFIEDVQGGTANSDYTMHTFNWGITTAGAATFVSVTQTSDIRRKNIISNLELSIEDIAKAPLFKFTWKDKEDKTVHIGTSAQYWQGLMPELTSENKNGVLGMQYDVAAMAGVTTVAKVVVDHEDRISTIERKLNIN